MLSSRFHVLVTLVLEDILLLVSHHSTCRFITRMVLNDRPNYVNIDHHSTQRNTHRKYPLNTVLDSRDFQRISLGY